MSGLTLPVDPRRIAHTLHNAQRWTTQAAHWDTLLPILRIRAYLQTCPVGAPLACIQLATSIKAAQLPALLDYMEGAWMLMTRTHRRTIPGTDDEYEEETYYAGH